MFYSFKILFDEISDTVNKYQGVWYLFQSNCNENCFFVCVLCVGWVIRILTIIEQAKQNFSSLHLHLKLHFLPKEKDKKEEIKGKSRCVSRKQSKQYATTRNRVHSSEVIYATKVIWPTELLHVFLSQNHKESTRFPVYVNSVRFDKQ